MVNKPSQQSQKPRKDKGSEGVKYPEDYGLDTGGDCVCPICGKRFPRRKGVPCYSETCPECGQKMTRA
jgi:hypothetical protein